MTAGEKLEQALTGRPGSFVPARALLTLLGRAPGDGERPPVWNHLMHWAVDQTIENATGVGAPPTSWPVLEQAVDVVHKAVHATVTGTVADRWISPALRSSRGRTSH